MCLFSSKTPKVTKAPAMAEEVSPTATDQARQAELKKRKQAWGMQQTFTGAGSGGAGPVGRQTIG